MGFVGVTSAAAHEGPWGAVNDEDGRRRGKSDDYRKRWRRLQGWVMEVWFLIFVVAAILRLLSGLLLGPMF